jgi:hypothetical protein
VNASTQIDMTIQVEAAIENHWHVRHAWLDGSATLEPCRHDPCVRSDVHYFVVPAVGPLGVEIRKRLTA